MTALVREKLSDAIEAANSAHPGLLLQRGWADHVKTDAANEGTSGKGKHIERICTIPASDLYVRAYQRWVKATADDARFTRIPMKIEGRLLIGLTGGGALETGCAVSHSYGMPYLPGSSTKGVVRAWAEKAMQDWKDQFDDLFGSTDLSGLVAFHDAWWIPDSGNDPHKKQPFAADIVTPHHTEYYAGGRAPVSDLDSPVPNNLVGVRGSFLFVLEGEPGWRSLASKMLEKALAENGIGAKTRAGYGYLSPDDDTNQRLHREAEQSRMATLPVDQRLGVEVAALTEKQIAEQFGPDVNKTGDRHGENFELFANLVRELHGALIESWKNETKKTNKPRWKAYRFFTGMTEEE